jgi:hypothetical protein
MYQQEYTTPRQHTNGLAIRFYMRSVRDEDASAEAGRAIHKDVEYIQKLVVGDNNSKVDRPVRREDIEQFRAQYEDWKRGVEQQDPGLPLSEWPGLSPAQVDTLRFAHITTVEKLSEVSDQNLSKLGMGYVELRQRARDYLAAAKGMAPLDEYRRKNAELQSHYEMARKQIEDLRREVESLKAAETSPGSKKRHQ